MTQWTAVAYIGQAGEDPVPVRTLAEWQAVNAANNIQLLDAFYERAISGVTDAQIEDAQNRLTNAGWHSMVIVAWAQQPTPEIDPETGEPGPLLFEAPDSADPESIVDVCEVDTSDPANIVVTCARTWTVDDDRVTAIARKAAIEAANKVFQDTINAGLRLKDFDNVRIRVAATQENTEAFEMSADVGTNSSRRVIGLDGITKDENELPIRSIAIKASKSNSYKKQLGVANINATQTLVATLAQIDIDHPPGPLDDVILLT